MGANVVEYGRVKWVATIVLCAICLCGCSLSKRLAAATARVEKMYANTKDWRELPEKTITWHQAVEMMRSNNLDLADIDDQIKQLERNSLSVYTDLIPGVSYYGYMTRTISELTTPMSSEELTSRVNVSFSALRISEIPVRVYESKARTYARIKQKEGKERELVSKLYQLVRRQEMEKKKDELMKHAPEDQKESIAQQEPRRRQAEEKDWQEIARLLGKRDARWHILPESMPRVVWEEYDPYLDRLSELVACDFALQLENARMTQYRIAVNYLPTVNTSLYSPSLFSSTGGTYGGTFLGKDDTRLDLSLSYMLDTKLSEWNNYQRNKANYERQQIRVADQMVDHRNKVRALRESMREYRNWRSFMTKHITYLRNSVPQNAEEYIEREQKIYNMEMELLNQETTAIEAEAAVVLEYGMPYELPRRTQR